MLGRKELQKLSAYTVLPEEYPVKLDANEATEGFPPPLRVNVSARGRQAIPEVFGAGEPAGGVAGVRPEPADSRQQGAARGRRHGIQETPAREGV